MRTLFGLSAARRSKTRAVSLRLQYTTVPEAGEGAGGAPLGGGSEDGAGALLPLAAGVVRETGGERSVGLA